MKVRTEARRLAIIEAAAELFKELGYERASMNELAKRLGGSKATLYGYFPSKETLFSAVARHLAMPHLTEATLALRTPAGSRENLEETLTAFAEKMLGILVNDADALAVYRMVIAESGHSDAGQLFYDSGPSESLQALSGWFRGAIEQGYVRAMDPSLLAIQFTALVTAETNARLYLRKPPAVSRATVRLMAKRAVELFLLGAASR